MSNEIVFYVCGHEAEVLVKRQIYNLENMVENRTAERRRSLRKRTVGDMGWYRPCMALKRDTKGPSNSRPTPITRHNIVRRKKLLPHRRNNTNRRPLVILFQPHEPMTPFNLKGR